MFDDFEVEHLIRKLVTFDVDHRLEVADIYDMGFFAVVGELVKGDGSVDWKARRSNLNKNGGCDGIDDSSYNIILSILRILSVV